MDQIVLGCKITTFTNGIPVINENSLQLSDIVIKATLKIDETVISTGKIEGSKICFKMKDLRK